MWGFPSGPRFHLIHLSALWTAHRIGTGRSVAAVAINETDGVVGVGSMQLVVNHVVSAAELTGIAVFPSHRRRGYRIVDHVDIDAPRCVARC